ncbi:DUF2157 domain-containing protein [Bacillus pinisoli]|uniref:DUF2157 domain-containing protein n=1 Tax=Bacillus pinisoli TaxID=2901866 RepID=UPI001FF3C94B|nr:DUF2157 domain-containing protein [Bacillus pinisoli]
MKKWLVKEGEQWVKDELISKEQLEAILKRYTNKKSSNLLPIFASVLIGLGILSFIASNWDGIHDLVRVGIIITSMTGFYVSGDRAHKRGNDTLGNGLIGIGLLSFGAGIFLLGQMFHFQSYDGRPFIFWGLAGLLIVQLWKSRFLLLITMIIVTVGQLYTFSQFSTFNYVLGVLLLFGVGHFVYHRPNHIITVLFSLSFSIQALLLIIHQGWNHQFLFVFFLGLYLLGDVVKKKEITKPVQMIMLVASVILAMFNIFFFDSFIPFDEFTNPELIIYGVLIISLLILFFVKKRKTPDLSDFILFLPVMFLGVMVDVLYLLLLFIYSISLLIVGYRDELTDKATFGTVLFLLSSFIGYIQLAWSFMPKSIFFLFGGIILFILSWFLEKRRRVLVKGVKRNG